MKRIALLIAFAMASSAWAQAPAPEKDAAKPEAAKPVPLPAPVKEAAKPKAQKSTAAARKSKRAQDARHCLERANNTEIIKCAEAFL